MMLLIHLLVIVLKVSLILNKSDEEKVSLKAMCEYIRRGQTSDFNLLSDAKSIFLAEQSV